MKRTTVLLADDHTILTDTLVPLLQRDFEVVGVARDGRTMIEMAKEKRPDVIVVDISMPLLNGIDATRMLRKDVPSAKCVFLSMHADLPLVEKAFRAGASGFVVKMCDLSELVEAIKSVAKGATYITPSLAGDLISVILTASAKQLTRNTPLSARQREILQFLAEGKTIKEAASLMRISTRTAESHKYEIMRLLGVRSSAAVIRYAIRISLI
jgi:DNA-binding NarL/FixJ family response regulator